MALSQVGLERLNTATTKKIGTNKNIIINGAMQVAQRGTSSTSSGMHTVDRFNVGHSGTDEAPTQSQISLTSSDTGPFESGFRKALRVTNGNQTGGLGAGDFIFIENILESQDIANSGWNYASSSSYLSLSFWVRSSIQREIGGFLKNFDGTVQKQTFTMGNVSANTWTKKTLLIAGDSDLQFADDNTAGFLIQLRLSYGSNFMSASPNLGLWVNNDSTALGQTGALGNDTWYTTNDATYDITGLQLEVGSVATDFEHKSFAEELRLCYRYFYHTGADSTDTAYFDDAGGVAQAESTTKAICAVRHPVEMRSTPTVTLFDAVDASGNVTQKGHTHGIPAVANQSGRIGFQRVSANGSPTFQLSGEKPVSFGYKADAEI